VIGRPARRVILHDPDHDPERFAMKFRLTYQGPLLAANNGNRRAKHKHEIRQKLHPQLRRFWDQHPYLQIAKKTDPILATSTEDSLRRHLMDQHARFNYHFVPLVTAELSLTCAIDILFLRPSMPGQILNSGDLDNRLKTLFDALRMPAQKDELGGYDLPQDTEEPFYCLLEDDRLITHVSVETDMILETIPNKLAIDPNDARLVITVNLVPSGNMGWHNVNFVAT
jgi:hypothetical protein